MFNKFIKYMKCSCIYLLILFHIKNFKLYYGNIQKINKIILLGIPIPDGFPCCASLQAQSKPQCSIPIYREPIGNGYICFFFLLMLFLFSSNIHCMECEVALNPSLKTKMKNKFFNKVNYEQCTNFLLTDNADYITYIPIELKREIFILIDERDQARLMSTSHEWKKILESHYSTFNQDHRHGLWQDNYNINTRLLNTLNKRVYSLLGMHINFCHGRGELGDWIRYCKLSCQIEEAPFLSQNSIIIEFLHLLKFHIYIYKKTNSNSIVSEEFLDDYKKLLCKIESRLLDTVFKKTKYYQNETYLYLYYAIFIENKKPDEIEKIKEKVVKHHSETNYSLKDLFCKYEELETLRSNFILSNNNKLFIMENILSVDCGPLLQDFRFMADACFILGEYEKAKQYYMELIQKSKNFYIFHDLRNAARCFLIAKNYREANKYYEEILIHFGSKATLDDLRDAAKAAFYCQEYNKSKKYIKKLMDLNSNIEKIHDYRFIACIYAAMNDYKKSIKYCKKVLNQVGDSTTIQDYRCIAYSYANLKKFYKSFQYYEKMINNYDTEITLKDFKNISFVYARIDNYDKSSKYYQKFLVLPKK